MNRFATIILMHIDNIIISIVFIASIIVLLFQVAAVKRSRALEMAFRVKTASATVQAAPSKSAQAVVEVVGVEGEVAEEVVVEEEVQVSIL